MTQEMKTKREELKGVSRTVQQLVKAGVYQTVNQGLVAMYGEDGHTTLHSFRQWLQDGYVVRKGEKALLLWGEPRNGNRQENTEEEEFSFFPLAYVFSQKQVEPLETKEMRR